MTLKYDSITTLNHIREADPCKEGWTKLLSTLGKTKAAEVAAARDTEVAAVRDAAWDTASSAAWGAAWDTAWDAQESKLREMLIEDETE